MRLYNLYLPVMRFIQLFILSLFSSFHPVKVEKPYIVVLGIAQDAGYPQIGCDKECCKKVYEGKARKQMVSSIAVVDPATKQKWIFDASPDLPEQLKLLESYQPGALSGILLTHAHIGHYTGLMYLGREAMNASKIPVYAMPRMSDFIKNNGPWSQLLTLNNIELIKLRRDSLIHLNNRISVEVLQVPHRDEFSETVGYRIITGKRACLYIPDIDKWNKWEKDLRSYEYDHAFIDGTFYKEGELPGRNMAEIPHPFVAETMSLFESSKTVDKRKIWFIHFNHTNPLMTDDSGESKEVKASGFNLARQGQVIRLN